MIEVGVDPSGAVEGFQQIESAGVRMAEVVAKSAERFGEAMEEMLSRMEERFGELERKQNSASGGSGGGGGMLGSLGRGVVGGVGAGLGLGAFFSIQSAISKIMSEGAAFSEEEARSGVLTGRGLDTGMTGYGFSAQSFGAYSRNLTNLRGTSDLERDRAAAIAERAAGQEAGSFAGFERFGRMGGEDLTTLMKEFYSRGSRSKLWDVEIVDGTLKSEAGVADAMQQVLTLTEQQGNLFTQVSSSRSMAILEAMSGIGGTFGDDPRAASSIMTMSSAIANPTNQYADAFIKQALSSGTNMSMFELTKLQQQGIFGEGNFGKVMSAMNSTFAEGDQRNMAIDTFTGGALTKDTVERLGSMTPSQIKEISEMLKNDDKEGLRSMLGDDFVEAAASKGTDELSRVVAKLDTMSGELGAGIIEELAPFIEKSLDWMEDLIKESDDIGDVMAKVADLFVASVDKFADSVTDWIFGRDGGDGNAAVEAIASGEVANTKENREKAEREIEKQSVTSTVNKFQAIGSNSWLADFYTIMDMFTQSDVKDAKEKLLVVKADAEVIELMKEQNKTSKEIANKIGGSNNNPVKEKN